MNKERVFSRIGNKYFTSFNKSINQTTDFILDYLFSFSPGSFLMMTNILRLFIATYTNCGTTRKESARNSW